MNEDIRFILEEALLAPSGDNTQPWQWIVRDSTLELWSRFPNDRLHDLYSSSSNRGSSAYLALGTAIENACIAATVKKFLTDVTYFPDSSKPTLVATIKLIRDQSVTKDELVDSLSVRMTNRHPYRRTPLTDYERSRLFEACTQSEFGELQILTDRSSIGALATIASLQDELMFSAKDLHDYIFSNINWTKRQDKNRRIGFYYPTLAAPPFSWVMMQLLSQWWFARLGTFFGLHKMISFEQRFVYRQAGAYGVTIALGNTPTDWIKVGRLTERVWLMATKLGLSVHPLNGVVLLVLGIDTDTAKNAFTSSQRERLKAAHAQMSKLFNADDKIIAFLFRIGHAAIPTARTSRLPFNDVVNEARS